MQAVDNFTYLGSTLSRAVNIDAEVNNRIAGYCLGAQGNQYNNKTESVLCCGVYTPPVCLWIVDCLPETCKASKSLSYNLPSPRYLTEYILSRANQPSIYTLLMTAQIRWAGYIVRMPDEFIPKQVLYCELYKREAICWRSGKRFKDTLKTSLKSFGIDTSTWEHLAVNLTTLREIINNGCQAAEEGGLWRPNRNESCARPEWLARHQL